MVYHLLDLQKYNYHGILIRTSNKDEINIQRKNLNPILFQNEESLIMQDEHINIGFNDEYIPLSQYLSDRDNQIYIYKNKELFLALGLKSNHFDLSFLNDYDQLCVIENSISVFKNLNSTLYKCSHNYNIIGILDGESTFYLFNPKHKKDIFNKSNQEIKKWGHRHVLQKGNLLFIPTNWYYIQETQGKVIQYHITADSYFTFIPNFFK